jgi:hypothetical protein
LSWHEKARGPSSKDRKHTARLGYAANCLRTAAPELPTLSTAFSSSSRDTKLLGPILDLEVLVHVDLATVARWPRLVRLSLIVLLYRLYKPLIARTDIRSLIVFSQSRRPGST